MTRRELIVNADDFGLSVGVNRGIVHAHRHGIVTRTSLMVREVAAEDAVEQARSAPDLALGLHVDLGEWQYTDGEWRVRYQVVALDDAPAVSREVERQVSAFEQLVGRLPTHLDSHQHVHHDHNVRPVLLAIGERIGVPVRALTVGISYNGNFYGQDGKGRPYPEALRVGALVEIIRTLPPGRTELACHPGLDVDLDSTYRDERAREVEVLCDPAVRAAIVECDVDLGSFAESTQR